MKYIPIALFAVAAVTLPAAAQEHGEEHREPRHQAAGPGAQGPGMPMMLEIGVFNPAHLLERREALGLTDAQAEQLEALRAEMQSAHEGLRQEAEGHWRQAHEAWESGDADGVRGHARQGMASLQNAQLAALNAAVSARSVLTDEQVARASGWLDAARERRHQMMERTEGLRLRMQGRMRGRMQGRSGMPGQQRRQRMPAHRR